MINVIQILHSPDRPTLVLLRVSPFQLDQVQFPHSRRWEVPILPPLNIRHILCVSVGEEKTLHVPNGNESLRSRREDANPIVCFMPVKRKKLPGGLLFTALMLNQESIKKMEERHNNMSRLDQSLAIKLSHPLKDDGQRQVGQVLV